MQRCSSVYNSDLSVGLNWTQEFSFFVLCTRLEDSSNEVGFLPSLKESARSRMLWCKRYAEALASECQIIGTIVDGWELIVMQTGWDL